MAFALQQWQLPQVRSYAEALKLYDNAKINKKDDNRRYLYRAYDQSKLIQFDANTEDVTMWYCNVPCVKWHKDGTVTLNLGGWYTVSTNAFMSALSGMGYYKKFGTTCVSVGYGYYGNPASKWRTAAFHNIVHLRVQDSPPRVELISGEVPLRKSVINRVKAKEAMAQWRHVLAHIKALCALGGGKTTEGVLYWKYAYINNETFDAPPTVEGVHDWVNCCVPVHETYETISRWMRKQVYAKGDVYETVEVKYD